MARSANKRPKELFVERLHANIDLARGNTAEPRVREFWVEMVVELNLLGCQRTVEEWQHIWDVWRSKVKTKARKVRDSINATGGGPAGEGLTDLDNKILEIIGPASVYGFADQEHGLLHTAPTFILPDEPAPPPEPVQIPQEQDQPLGPRTRRPRTDIYKRRVGQRRPRPPVNENLVQALDTNHRLYRQVIQEAGAEIAAAIRESGLAVIRAAEILAAAIPQFQTVAAENREST